MYYNLYFYVAFVFIAGVVISRMKQSYCDCLYNYVCSMFVVCMFVAGQLDRCSQIGTSELESILSLHF